MYFDRDTIRVLKYIRKCGKNGAEWSDILKKFEYANQGMLLIFNSDLYACAYRQNGDPVPFETMKVKEVKGIRSYCTPKGNQLLEERSFNFWKWTIPTFISLISLLISMITFWYTLYGNDVLKVMLLN